VSRALSDAQAALAGIARTGLVRVTGAGREHVEDDVAIEEPLEIRISGETFAVTMRTPGRDFELVAGLLLAEGLIQSRADIGALAYCGRPGEEGAKNVVEVTPAPGARFADVETFTRRSTVVSAACGICGRVTIDDLVERLGGRDDPARFSASFLAALPERLSREQPNFARTGGLHAAGAARPEGPLELVREDVGRHNAVDKVVGRLLLDGQLPAAGQALVVSGRASFEIVQKALTARFSAVVSVSAPSSLAIATAARFNLVLLGFVRAGGFNVYSGADRLT
jgi:FdhD protein